MNKITAKIKLLFRFLFIRERIFCEGVRDGIPIGLGYFAVAFSLGFTAREAGLNAFQGFLASLLNNASAGEYAGFTVIKENAPYWQMAVMILIANARYLLMSCALSQRFSPQTQWYHRVLIGYDVTDELFGITIGRKGSVEPKYFYGAMLCAVPGWSVGTLIGVIAGNVLPARIVSALGVALFGMFIAIIIPPARENKIIRLAVIVSFVSSYAVSVLPYLSKLSEGTRIMLLTVVLSVLAALFFPIKEEACDEK